MVRLSKLFLMGALALSLVAPALADGRKGKPNFVAPPVPPLRVPNAAPPAPMPPPTPVEVTKGPGYISLPANFGTGGVGADITGGGYVGGGRVIITGGASAQASARAFAFAFASASANATAGAHSSGGCGCGHR